MSLRKNQRIQISEGWQDEGRQGTHLATVNHKGKTWHIVQMDNEHEPRALIVGTIEASLSVLKQPAVANPVVVRGKTFSSNPALEG